MIIDNIKNAERYYCLGEGFKEAFEFFANYDGQANEKADITLSDDVMVKCRPYVTKPVSECRFEAHKEYADIHFVVSGCECIGYAPTETLTVVEENPEKDMIFLEGDGVNIPLNPGDFMITFPQDAHMPCVKQSQPVMCGKFIAKVKL